MCLCVCVCVCVLTSVFDWPGPLLVNMLLILQHLAASVARVFLSFILSLCSTFPFLLTVHFAGRFLWNGIGREAGACALLSTNHITDWEVWLANGSSDPSARVSRLMRFWEVRQLTPACCIIAGQADCSRQTRTTLRLPGNGNVQTGCLQVTTLFITAYRKHFSWCLFKVKLHLLHHVLLCFMSCTVI